MNESLSKKMTIIAPATVRIGLSLVFLWFGSQQILDANVWTGLIPTQVTQLSGISALSFVYMNGAFEIIFGLCLLVGFFTRLSALLLAIHLLGITVTIGYNDVGVRDFGLTMASLSVFLYGADAWSLDRHLEKRRLPAV
jgi:uncharacterized membrane protein YphA (DoxX/SURF4 family)